MMLDGAFSLPLYHGEHGQSVNGPKVEVRRF